MNPTPELRDPKTLRVHPLTKLQPELGDEDPTFLRICRSIQGDGIQEPIKITSEGEIVDGRHRWRGAKRLKLPEVPCVVVPPDEVAGIVLSSLLARRHYTGAQLAYVLTPMIEPAFQEAHRRMLQGKTDPANAVRRVSKNLEDWASEIGVSVRYLQQAKELHEFFKDSKKRQLTDRDGNTENDITFKEFFEPRLLADQGEGKPYGIGGILAGIKQHLDQEAKAAAGKAHTGGKPKELERQLELFTGTFTKDLTNRFEYWNGFDADTKAAAITSIGTAVEKMPDDLLTKLSKRLSAEIKRRKKEQKHGK